MDLHVQADDVRRLWPADADADSAAPEQPAPASAAPTYAPPVEPYVAKRVPDQFNSWARQRHDAGELITLSMAFDAMAGPADGAGKRHGGLLKMGPGLARRTISAWVKSLPADWYAERGETQQRRRGG